MDILQMNHVLRIRPRVSLSAILCKRRALKAKYRICKNRGVGWNAGHVAAYVPASIIDSGVKQCQEGMLNKFSSTQSHVLNFLCTDTEFDVIKQGRILQKWARIGVYLTQPFSFPSEFAIQWVTACRACKRNVRANVESIRWDHFVGIAPLEQELEERGMVQVFYGITSARKLGRYSNLFCKWFTERYVRNRPKTMFSIYYYYSLLLSFWAFALVSEIFRTWSLQRDMTTTESVWINSVMFSFLSTVLGSIYAFLLRSSTADAVPFLSPNELWLNTRYRCILLNCSPLFLNRKKPRLWYVTGIPRSSDGNFTKAH